MFIPSDAYIDECMKIFARFLKDIGKYHYIMKYLFGYGRNKKKFYNDVRFLYSKPGRRYDFGDILHITWTLGPADKIINWEEFIKPISDDFRFNYFPKHKHKIKVDS